MLSPCVEQEESITPERVSSKCGVIVDSQSSGGKDEDAVILIAVRSPTFRKSVEGENEAKLGGVRDRSSVYTTLSLPSRMHSVYHNMICDLTYLVQ